MTMTTTERAIDQLIEDQFPVFGDIAKVMGEVPDIPEGLLEFDAPISNRRTREVAHDMFLAWLQVRLTGRSPRIPTEEQLPCADNPEIYSQSWPVAEDFPDGNESPEYQLQSRRVELQTAIAKEGCSMCPLAVQRACLLKALDYDREYSALPEVIMGGWGDGARAKIQSQLMNFIRSYERGIREDAGLGRIGAAEAGMSKEVREECELLAMELEVAC
ncbi:MAG: hypothetical protein WED09_05365 [Homoserinimonas sp.]